MLARRRFRSNRTFVRKPRTRYQWVRSSTAVSTPVLPNTISSNDLLADWRTKSGIAFNFPDIVIWRIILSISIRFTIAPATFIESQDRVTLAVYVDSMAQTVLSPVIETYGQKYMMWDNLYGTEFLMSSSPAGTAGELVFFKRYDIRTHRKLTNQEESLLLVLAPVNAFEILNYTYSQNTLIKLP